MTRLPSFSKQTVGFANSRPQTSGVCFLAEVQQISVPVHMKIEQSAGYD
jgi:hypothetical protein